MDVEGICGELVAAFAIGDDVVELNVAVEIRVRSEAIFGVINLGDETTCGGEPQNGEVIAISVGVTGEEISGGDGIDGVFCAGVKDGLGA